MSNMSCTWPPIRSVIALPAPRYGTCTMFTPAISLNNSPGHVDAGADAGRSEVELAGIGFRVGDELGNGGDRDRLVHHQDVRHADHARDRRDVTNEIEAQLVVERVVDRVRRNHLEQRVAVRRGLHHGLGPDIAAGARPVLDDDRLTEPLRQPLRHQTGQDVGPAAGGEADDDAHRLRRVGLRDCSPRQRRERGGSGCQMEKLTAGKFHRVTLHRMIKNFSCRRSPSAGASHSAAAGISWSMGALPSQRLPVMSKTTPSGPRNLNSAWEPDGT